MTWVSDGDLTHCTRHNQRFKKPGACTACVADPGPPPEQSAPETLDEQSIADEQWCRSQRDMLITIARAAVGEEQERTIEPPAQAGVEGEERDGWWFWRGSWRSKRPAKDLDVGLSTVAKIADTALKFHRAAVDERRRRGEFDHERWLVKECRRLKRSAGASN